MGLLFRLAWRNVWRRKRRTALTASALGIGVAFCLALTSLADGMYAQAFRQMVTDGMGHIQVHAPAFPAQRALEDYMDHGDDVRDAIRATRGVGAVSGRAFGYALLSVEDLPLRPQKSAGGEIIGITPSDEAALSRIDQKIVEGRYLSASAKHEVILGAGLAKALRARMGEKLVAVTQAADGSLGNDLFEVVGVFKTGNAIFDRSGCYTHIDDLRALVVLGEKLHEIAVNAADPAAIAPLLERVKAVGEPRGLLVRDWKTVSPLTAQMLSIQDLGNGLLLLIVFGLATLSVLNTMLMSVFERTRELGVMRALGMRPSRTVALVLAETMVLITLAGVGGGCLGLMMDAYLIHYGFNLTSMTGDFTFGGMAFPPVLKGVFRVEPVVLTLVGLLVVSLLASIWPASRAASITPTSAMRKR